MELLDALTDPHRELLLAAATELRLRPGELLIHRGEEGGDLYRLQRGTLEVIDARLEPPVVLAVVGSGAMLGEMAFLDGSVRSADVRAAEECVCLQWRRAELLALLEAEPVLGLAVYRALAGLVNARSRNVRAVALDGRRAPSASAALDHAEEDVVEPLRRRLLAVEPRLRSHPETGRAEVSEALDAFLEGLAAVSERLGVEGRRAVLPRIGEEVRPWLMRSQLGELLAAPPSGHTDDPAVLAHVLAGEPAGDGELGKLIDAWLLGLPTSEGLRARAAALREEALRDAPARVTVVNGEAGLLRALGDVDTLDGTALTAWVLGDVPHRVRDRDLVVLDGLLDSLPDRGAGPVLRAARRWLAPGGRLVGSSLLPAPDADLFRFVLGWPQVHRRARAIEGLLARAGFVDIEIVRCGAGLVWRGRV